MDPESFDAVFFQNFSSSESKFMPYYKNTLLKVMTYDILSELLGKDNFKTTSNIIPLAISNAFYEQIVLHYGLEKLTPWDDSSTEKSSKGITHQRGDLLKAYMTAIEKDISRDGRGYREIRDWLFRILDLRLRRLAVQDGTALCSSGTEQQSLTILPSISADIITHFGTELKDSNIFASKTDPLLNSTTHNKTMPSSSQTAAI
jgi:hypothetical protein